MTWRLIDATAEDMQRLYDESSLTFEGTTTDAENMQWLYDWLVEHGALAEGDPLEIFVVKGSLMNSYYHLTGSNQYPGQLNIVCLPLSQFKEIGGITLARFQCGGRWFDDVVDNNSRREGRED